jgi:response regulator of citrate/malate metabolism
MSKRINVLICDNSPTVKEKIKELVDLHFDNYDILESETGEHVLEDLKSFSNIDLLFLANTLPDMDGQRVLSLIREKEEFNSVRIVMTMSEENKEKLQSFTKLGIFDFLVKPFCSEQMERISKKLTAFK